MLFLFSWYNHVYPKYCQCCKKDDDQWTQETLSLKTVINELDLQRKQLFNKKSEKENLQLFATKLTEKTPNPSNAKEYDDSYLKRKKKNAKSVKWSKIITQQPKTFDNQNYVDIKSKTSRKLPKTSHKWSKTIG